MNLKRMPNNSKIVKKANSFLVLNAMRNHASITVEGVMDATGLSRPTVLSILKKLIDDDLVTPLGTAQTDSGRHPVLYALNATRHFVVGIDVDGPPINLVVADLSGAVHYSATWTISLTEPGEQIAAHMIAEIDSAVKQLGIKYDKLLGIAVGLPAVVDIAANSAVRISRLPNWDNFPLAETIAQHTGVKAYIRNDAHLLGIAEHSMLAGTDNTLYIVHRSGIGMSIMIGNQPYEGAQGNSGYVGHTTLVVGGNACDCGSRGCFEAHCSKRAIVRAYAEAGGDALSYAEILNRATDREALALQILEEAGSLFGIAVSNLIKTFEIYTVILGDMACDEQHPFFRSIALSVAQNLQNYTDRKPCIQIGGLSDKDFGLGGCHLVLSKYFAHPKLRLQ